MPKKTSLLRLVGRLEALSFLILVGIAMPLKYVAGRPEFVKWTGWFHGILFVVYVAFVLAAWQRHRWPFIRPFLLGCASLIPFGPFLLEKRLAQWESK
jgi:integral membrane protein